MPSLDRYIIVSTSAHQLGVIKATDALEDAGIPVMVQHVFMDQTTKGSQYRVMVPDKYTHRASQVISSHLPAPDLA